MRGRTPQHCPGADASRPRGGGRDRARPAGRDRVVRAAGASATCAGRSRSPSGCWATGRTRRTWCRRRCSPRSRTSRRSTLAPFGPWLYRIVVTRGLNFRKSRVAAADGIDRPRASSPAAEPGPGVATERAALREAVTEALARLPERQRMVVQLFELDGFSGAEIAAMLGDPAGYRSVASPRGAPVAARTCSPNSRSRQDE